MGKIDTSDLLLLSQYMTEGTFNWRMMKTLFTQLHVYDKEKNYVPFDHGKEQEDAWLAIQRKVLPNAA